MSLGKALGAGVPVGAALVSDKVAATISYGDHDEHGSGHHRTDSG
jgi:acetylornithine/succinyldiaminopimelate/putrescine aminotransferase